MIMSSAFLKVIVGGYDINNIIALVNPLSSIVPGNVIVIYIVCFYIRDISNSSDYVSTSTKHKHIDSLFSI